MGVRSLLVSARQASEILGISPRTLWSLTNSRQISCIRIGRSVRYCLDDLKHFIDAQRDGGAE